MDPFQRSFGYLGCAPINAATEQIIHDAMQILRIKLEKLQTKVVDRVVEKKFGTRLSPASPVYQKIAAKMTKNGRDCTKGDPVSLSWNDKVLCMVELKGGSKNEIQMKHVVLLQTLPSTDGDNVIFSFVQDKNGELLCHGLLCKESTANATFAELSKLISVLPKRKVTSKQVGNPNHIPQESTVTLGIGLHRKSSLRASSRQRSMRRKPSVNLSGTHRAPVKFRPAGLHSSFASLGDTPKSPITNISNEPPISPTIEIDDDLLDLDEDLFVNDDSLNDDELNPDDIDLSGLNFNE